MIRLVIGAVLLVMACGGFTFYSTTTAPVTSCSVLFNGTTGPLYTGTTGPLFRCAP